MSLTLLGTGEPLPLADVVRADRRPGGGSFVWTLAGDRYAVRESVETIAKMRGVA